jgi:acyl transferase domain-containing protein
MYGNTIHAQPGSRAGTAPGRPAELLVLSADSPAELEGAATALADRLVRAPGVPLFAAARELYARPALPFRRALVAADTAEAVRLLRPAEPGPRVVGPADPARPVVFMFPGVGDHYAGMARDLYRHEPVFRSALDRCADVLHGELGVDLRTVLYAGEAADKPAGTPGKLDLAALLGRRDGRADPSGIDRTRVAQPMVFSVEYALAQLLISWGIVPAGLVGYSIGEYVAACLADVLSIEDALVLVARRAELVETMPPGGMLVVMLGADALESYLDGALSLAAVDGDRLCVAAGPPDALRRLEARLTSAGVANLPAVTQHAFHSSMMTPLAEPLERLLRTFPLRAPSTPFLSNVSGTWISDDEAISPAYWARHLHRTVRFHDDLTELWRLPSVIALEVGPGQMLGSLAAQHPDRPAGEDLPVFSTLPGASARRDDLPAVLGTVGALWQAGVPVDLIAFGNGRA